MNYNHQSAADLQARFEADIERRRKHFRRFLILNIIGVSIITLAAIGFLGWAVHKIIDNGGMRPTVNLIWCGKKECPK